MKHDPALARLLLLHARDGGQEEAIARYPKALVLDQQERLIGEGLASGRVIADGLRTGWIKNFRITPAGHRQLERVEGAASDPATLVQSTSSIRIFISHSTGDADIAEALANLFEKALRLGPESIRCTSVVGYALPIGASIDDQLRAEIIGSEVLVALITPAALQSTYVLFELGARWGLNRPIFPVLATGMTASDLTEPLKHLVAANCDKREDILTLVESLAAVLRSDALKPTAFERTLVNLLAASKRPNISTAARPKRNELDDIELSGHEISVLMAVNDFHIEPILLEIVADTLLVTIARARQTVESIRRKGLVGCRPTRRGDVEYFRTDAGNAWLTRHTSNGART